MHGVLSGPFWLASCLAFPCTAHVHTCIFAFFKYHICIYTDKFPHNPTQAVVWYDMLSCQYSSLCQITFFHGFASVSPPPLSNLHHFTFEALAQPITFLHQHERNSPHPCISQTLLQNLLELRRVPYLYLDGSIPTLECPQLLVTFSDPTSPHLVFLLPTQAGGMGLNLQA